jgi:methionyl-tRNA formyltransferase
MLLGEEAVLESLTKINKPKLNAISQNEFQDANEKLIPAPKIFKQDCLINWNDKGKNIYNKIRGLSPYPTAYSILKQAGKDLTLKIYKASFIEQRHNNDSGRIIIEDNKKMLICVPDGYINILELQLQSKKRMSIGDFLKGFVINSTENFFIS